MSNESKNPEQPEGFTHFPELLESVQQMDAMLKAANVTLLGQIPIGGAYNTTVVQGGIGSVRAAVDAGSNAASQIGTLVSAHVIARPSASLLANFIKK